MEYPRPIMKKTELQEMGFPRDFLTKAYLKGGIAWKADPIKRNSAVLYDTQALEKYRLETMRINHTITRR